MYVHYRAAVNCCWLGMEFNEGEAKLLVKMVMMQYCTTYEKTPKRWRNSNNDTSKASCVRTKVLWKNSYYMPDIPNIQCVYWWINQTTPCGGKLEDRGYKAKKRLANGEEERVCVHGDRPSPHTTSAHASFGDWFPPFMWMTKYTLETIRYGMHVQAPYLYSKVYVR